MRLLLQSLASKADVFTMETLFMHYQAKREDYGGEGNQNLALPLEPRGVSPIPSTPQQ